MNLCEIDWSFIAIVPYVFSMLPDQFIFIYTDGDKSPQLVW